ncbi:LCCL domain [Plasmodium coatneyi]|uniref:LCCL domain n=1 Tax=Plasmodium coatneyi TaxID=208452 RepID=A0A1B1DT84_9APIC|nr:LCCL domain [Plasmodium coatneyi]ANQ05983.1 LCCL domain [Plasmodium coatneyi]
MAKRTCLALFCCFVLKGISVLGRDPTSALERITEFRQQHRRTLDGRLCAAAFLHDDQTYTDCTSATSPDGTSGREWCYVEVQLLGKGSRDWDYCANAVNYDKLRLHAKKVFEDKSIEADRLKERLHVLNSRVHSMLQKYDSVCGSKHQLVSSRIGKINQWVQTSVESLKKIEENASDLDATRNIMDKVQVEMKRENNGFIDAEQNCEHFDGYEKEPYSDGLKVSYFNNPFLEGIPVESKMEKKINLAYSNRGPSEMVSPYRYSLRYEGYLMSPHSGMYTFTVETNCYARLLLNEKVVLAHGFVQSGRNRSGAGTEEIQTFGRGDHSSLDLHGGISPLVEMTDEPSNVVKVSKPIELVGGEKSRFVLEVSHSSHLQYENGNSMHGYGGPVKESTPNVETPNVDIPNVDTPLVEAASFSLFWQSSRIDKQPIQSSYLFQDNVVPPVRFSGLDADKFDVGVVDKEEQVFTDDTNWVISMVPNKYLGLHLLKTNSIPQFSHFSVSMNTGCNLYIASPMGDIFPLSPSKEGTTWKAFDTDDQIELVHSVTKEKKIYKLKFIPLRNPMVLEIDVLVGVPFWIISENRKILPTICSGDEEVLSNPQNEVFMECTASSSLSAEFNCLAAFSTYHTDKKNHTWKTSNGSIGQFVKVYFKKPVQISKFKFKPRDDMLSWPSELALHFDDDEEVVLPILHTHSMEQNTTRLEHPVITTSVKIEVRDMFERASNNTGGSFELIGSTCNVMEDDYMTHHAVVDITQCDSTLNNLPDVMPLMKGNKILAICHEHCLENSDKEITYGSELYSTDSAICKTAIHAGVCKKDDKSSCRFLIVVNGGQANFVGSLQNNVMSLSRSSNTNFSFSLSTAAFTTKGGSHGSYTATTPSSYSVVFKSNDHSDLPNKFLLDSGREYTNYGSISYGWKNAVSSSVGTASTATGGSVLFKGDYPFTGNSPFNGLYSGGIEFPPASASQNCISGLDCEANFWKFQMHENGTYSVQVLVGNKTSPEKQKAFVEVNGIPIIKGVDLARDEVFVATESFQVTNRSLVFTSTCLGGESVCSRARVSILAVQIVKA